MINGYDIAGKYKIDIFTLADFLVKKNYMTIESGKWRLTELGQKTGAILDEAPGKDGLILWPQKILSEIEIALLVTPAEEKANTNNEKTKLYITVSKIADKYHLEPTKVNMILSEIGWIDKDQILGWRVTEFGKKLGGVERESGSSGLHYVTWPAEMLENTLLSNLLEAYKKQTESAIEGDQSKKQEERINKFRQDLPGNHRTKDGHWVRSRAEVIIDDALYYYEVPHAYERKVPVEEEIYSDFYLPQVKVYIEFWGMESDEKYLVRKKKKIELYKKYNLNLIELTDEHIKNLDDHLPRLLLKFGLRVF